MVIISAFAYNLGRLANVVLFWLINICKWFSIEVDLYLFLLMITDIDRNVDVTVLYTPTKLLCLIYSKLVCN